MLVVTLSSKGQLVIPKEVRKSVSLIEGDQLSVSVTKGEIRLRRLEPIVPVTLDQVAGCMAKPGKKIINDNALKALVKKRLKAKFEA